MNGYPELDRLRRADPRDAGCAQAKEMLYGYAELVAVGRPSTRRYRSTLTRPYFSAPIQAITTTSAYLTR